MPTILPVIITTIILATIIPNKLRNVDFIITLIAFTIGCSITSCFITAYTPKVFDGIIEEFIKTAYAILLTKKVNNPILNSNMGAITGASFALVEEILFATILPNQYRIMLIFNHMVWTYIIIDSIYHDSKPITIAKIIMVMCLHTALNMNHLLIKIAISFTMIATGIYIIYKLRKQNTTEKTVAVVA